MKKIEQHVLLEIECSLENTVAYVTDLGWADHISMRLDMTSRLSALESAVKFIRSIEVAPGGNDSAYEELVEDGADELSRIIEELLKIDIFSDDIVVVNSPLGITVSMTNSYQVDFGDVD